MAKTTTNLNMEVNMKTLEQIKDEESVNHGWKSYNAILDAVNTGVVSGFSFADLWEDITERYATECAREALRLASENANMEAVHNGVSRDIIINKHSILSENNLPKHI